MKLTLLQQQEYDDLVARFKLLDGLGYKASAEALARKINAMAHGVDLEAPAVGEPDRRPRKRVTRSRPIGQGKYIVNLTCKHQVTVNGVRSKQAPSLRAPFTAICTVCNP